jgi:hypothetical protein
MIQFRTLSVAIVVGSAMFFSRPAAAQYGNGSKSLMHTVSVTIAPRVKVELSLVSLMSSHSAPAAVKLTSNQGSAEGLALSVHATQSWVLSMKSSGPVDRTRGSRVHWASSPSGNYSAITSADTVLVAGARAESRADTAVYFRDAQNAAGSRSVEETVILTVSAP